MTYPPSGGEADFVFQGAEIPTAGERVGLDDVDEKEPTAGPETEATRRYTLPPPIIGLSDEQMDRVRIWVDQWIFDLENSQSNKMRDWAEQEEAYRALESSVPTNFEPFKGASRDVVPVAAMQVDPIHARLETGVFKQDPIFHLKPLKPEIGEVIDGVSRFLDMYMKRYVNLRQVVSPRILEQVKLGTMVLKTIYDRDERRVLKYNDDYTEVVEGREVRFAGPRVLGISLGDALFPPDYSTVDDCPVFFERQRTTYEKLLILQATGKITNVEKLKGLKTVGQRTELEEAREESTDHALRSSYVNEIIVHEGWCDYDIDGDGLPERLVVTYHKPSRTFLQLRVNWYFHQRKPYTLAPLTVTNDSLYGLGIIEMAKPFQDMITRWQRMSQDNAYLANIRMFIARKGSLKERIPRLYTGRVFYVDEPTKDFIPFAAADVYPSTIVERQNLFGMLEKRTGVSDYLIGRESPIIGTRATATSTLALLQQGAIRVEEVLENVRAGLSEVVLNCFSIWIQYGTGGLEDVMFGPGSEVATKVKAFFAMVNQENINGMFAVDLTVSDAATNRQAQQQQQLALIQIFMQYLEKLLEAGQGALQAINAGVPQYAAMVNEVMRAAREMFRDLAVKYEVPDPDKWLPELEQFINGPAPGAVPGEPPGGSGVGGGGEGGVGGLEAQLGLPVGLGPYRGPSPARPATPGANVGTGISEEVARASQGIP